ncbi:MAG TPA: GNAT family N-acetyltransferase [Thermoanaerobaculia bacterium]|nr:GNAT family N-acetyltransferase [Thermoanaerobaculia bacterium]
MIPMPTLTTERLLLRPFAPADAPELQRLAGHIEIARNTLSIPHPYPDGAAEHWIGGHAEQFAASGDVHFAIVPRDSGVLAGAIGLLLNRDHERAEIGYWIGVQWWGRGYAAEAAQATVDYGFTVATLNRIFAAHFTRNPASGRVLQKIGMRHEGTQRQVFRKWGEFLDAEQYAILRRDWAAASRSPRPATRGEGWREAPG